MSEPATSNDARQMRWVGHTGEHDNSRKQAMGKRDGVDTLRRRQVDIPSGLDPIRNMCNRWYHSSIVKDETLYIYGGYETFVDSNFRGNTQGDVSMGTNNYLISVAMNESWIWDYPTSSLPLISEQVVQPTSTDNVPSAAINAALFSGNLGGDQIYLYGGSDQNMNTSFYNYAEPTSTIPTILSYDLGQNEWSKSFDESSTNFQKPSYGASADVPDQGLGFYFNGELNNGTDSDSSTAIRSSWSIPLQGMVMVNTTDNTMRNISTAGLDTNGHISSILQYIPGIGEKGILVQFGGSYRPAGIMSDNATGAKAPMNQIHIFDINSVYDGGNGTWYTQQASGTIPEERMQSCSVVATAPDNSSYNIYMYGGTDGSATLYDDIYILSIPSFTWMQVDSGSATPSPRFGHTCHVVGNSQMLTVGGTTRQYSACDWESKGVAIYNMSSGTWDWGSSFDHDAAAYTVPELITNAIGGNSTGFAKVVRPIGDFTSPQLASLFNQTLSAKSSAQSTSSSSGVQSISTGSSTPVSSSDPKTSDALTSTNHTGAIVGATLGVVAAVMFATCLLWFFRRRAAAKATKAKDVRSESRQSLMMEDGNSTTKIRQYVMSVAYDANNPCHVPEALPPTKELDIKAIT